MPNLRVAHLPATTPYARKLAPAGISVANRADEASELPIDLTFAALADGGSADFEILHVHSVEFASEAEISRAVEGCRARRQGFVATVHDLSPAYESPDSSFETKVDLVCTQASSVITLTTGAAERLRRTFAGRRWLERVTVIPHGWVIPAGSVQHHARAADQPVRYGLLGVFRPNRDVWTAIVNWYYALQGEQATLTLFTRAFEPRRLHDPALRAAEILEFAHARQPRVRIVVRPHPTDADVASFMREIDVLLLPYTSGSHSGQLELAFDAGVLPLTADVGLLREQAADAAPYVRHQPVWFDWSDGAVWRYGRRFCEALLEAHARALAAPAWQAEALDAWRLAQHETILEAHARIYASAGEG
jgi:hypothetical protein